MHARVNIPIEQPTSSLEQQFGLIIYIRSLQLVMYVLCILPFWNFNFLIHFVATIEGISVCLCMNHWIYLDGRLVWKNSKRHFFQDIKKSFHGATQIVPKPHQIFFWKNISTNMVARGVQSFGWNGPVVAGQLIKCQNFWK